MLLGSSGPYPLLILEESGRYADDDNEEEEEDLSDRFWKNMCKAQRLLHGGAVH